MSVNRSGSHTAVSWSNLRPAEQRVIFHLGDTRYEAVVPESTCLLAFRGSVAHNMCTVAEYNSIDDIDLMGIVPGDPEHYLGLTDMWSSGTKEIKEGPIDNVLYDVKKMFRMLLNGNPNVMSLLWVKPEHYLLLTDAGRRIIENRNLFVGKHLFHSFAGYANGQLQKATSRDPAELRDYMALTAAAKFRGIHPQHKGQIILFPEDYDHTTGEAINAKAHSNEVLLSRLGHYIRKGENIGYMGDKRKQLVLKLGADYKNLAHCVRLLRMVIGFLQTGEMEVFRSDAAELLQIKRGEWSLERVKSHAEELFAEARDVYEHSPMREKPDSDGAEKLLISILRAHLGRGADGPI